MSEAQRAKQRQGRVGVVVAKSGIKTVRVKIERLVKHPVYKRYVRRSRGFLAHDEREECNVGDQVEIVESRPLSARKRWRVRRVMNRADSAGS